MMRRQSVLKRHAGLVDKMADRVDVDLEEKILRGELDPEDVTEMVLRCTSCTNPDECAAMLESGPKDGSVPSYCRNAEALKKLSDKS